MENVNELRTSNLIMKDPVSATMLFELRWHAFFNTVILNPDGGKMRVVRTYCWRVESIDH